MTNTETRVLELINTLFGVNIECLDTSLDKKMVDDLRLDSLDLVELTMATEDEFHIEISDHEAEPFASDDGTIGKTVREFCALVESKLATRAAA